MKDRYIGAVNQRSRAGSLLSLPMGWLRSRPASRGPWHPLSCQASSSAALYLAAREAGVGIIARVPLALGLLGGKYTHDTTFRADDHRYYNRAPNPGPVARSSRPF